ncbi:MAG: hypothetical protein IJ060_07080 [Oscillospiraceae bacterium]|nr:hypothetical protein [Oscillospiraceae bacterium]
MINKHQISAIVASATLAVGMVSCGDSSSSVSTRVSRVLKHIDAGEYDEAYSYVNEHELKDKEKTELANELKTRIDNAIAAYAEGAEDADYNSTYNLISCAQRMNLPDLIEPLAEASTKLSALYNSKTSFESGKSYYESGDYLRAIQQLSNVTEDDTVNYEQAKTMMDDSLSKYKTELEEEVKRYTDAGNYDEALEVLKNRKYAADGNEDAVKIIDQMIADIGVDGVLDKAQKLLDDGDLNGALEAVEEFENDYDIEDSRLTEFTDHAKSDYIEIVLRKANELTEQKNYIAALNMIKSAKEVVSDSRLDDLEKKIMELKPTYLYDLTLTNSNRFEVLDTGDAPVDTVGNSYPVGNLFTISSSNDGWSTEIGSAEYNLSYRYDTLSGTIAVHNDSSEATGVLKIIGDDVTLYSLNLQRALTPTSFSIDVSSVNWLKITIEDPQNGQIIAILSDFQFGTGSSSEETTTGANAEGDTTTETTTETTAG